MKRQLFERLTRPAALFLLIAGALALGLSDAAWATPAQRPFGQTIPTRTPGAETQTPGAEKATAAPTATPVPTIATGATSDTAGPGQLEVHRIDQGGLPPNRSGMTSLGQAIEVVLVDARGDPIEQSSVDRPSTICFDYTAGDLAAIGGDASNLIVQHYDTSLASPAWVNLSTTVNRERSRVCVSTTRLGMFTLAGRLASAATDLPTTGGELATSAPWQTTWWLIWLLIALAILAALAILVRRRRNRPSAGA